MKMTGNYILNAPKEDVWELIHNPASLMEIIPGCQSVEQVSPTEYRGHIQMKLPAIVGEYTTYVKLTDFHEPDYCHFKGEVSGAPGAITGTASFNLLEETNLQTRIEFSGQGLITGPLARLNDRFAEGIAKTLINQGLAQLDKQLQQIQDKAEA